jgi:VIT1/CCC1 family predicted Fe2+/Mn2+ transporter
MARQRLKRPVARLALWVIGIVFSSALGGFLALFFYYFLRNYLPVAVVIPMAVGLAVMCSFFAMRLIRLESALFRGVSPLIAGLIAGIGVHMARFWLA